MKLEDLKLNEMTTLSRLQRHFQPGIAMGIISAWRGGNDKDQLDKNYQATRALAADIQKAKYGYVFVDGRWIENEGTEKEFTVKETSIIVVGREKDSGNLKRLLKEWMQQFNQEAVIYKPEWTDKAITISNTGNENSIGTFKADRISSMMTILRGRGERTFIISEHIFYNKNWFGRRVDDIDRKENLTERRKEKR